MSPMGHVSAVLCLLSALLVCNAGCNALLNPLQPAATLQQSRLMQLTGTTPTRLPPAYSSTGKASTRLPPTASSSSTAGTTGQSGSTKCAVSVGLLAGLCGVSPCTGVSFSRDVQGVPLSVIIDPVSSMCVSIHALHNKQVTKDYGADATCAEGSIVRLAYAK